MWDPRVQLAPQVRWARLETQAQWESPDSQVQTAPWVGPGQLAAQETRGLLVALARWAPLVCAVAQAWLVSPDSPDPAVPRVCQGLVVSWVLPGQPALLAQQARLVQPDQRDPQDLERLAPLVQRARLDQQALPDLQGPLGAPREWLASRALLVWRGQRVPQVWD